MKKVLITGSTSSQVSIEAQRRSPRFCGLLNSAFSYSGTQAEVRNVTFESFEKEKLDNYDLVIVGLAPFTSLSANTIFNSLHTINMLRGSSKLKIVLDAPEPHLVYRSFRSVLANNDILTKNLYSKRSGYNLVSSNNGFKKSVLDTMNFLMSGEYDIIVPSLPYFEPTRSVYGIPEGGSHKDLLGFNFDHLFSSFDNSSETAESKFWLVENINAKWAKNISQTLSNPVLPVKRNQYESQNDSIKRMQESYGYLLNTYKNGLPWWSPNIAVALSCNTPIFSDWRHTGLLGFYWSFLPHTIEEYSREERSTIARHQKETYFSLDINSFDSEVSKLNKKLFS